MTTDHNEAMNQLPHKLATLIQCLPQAPFREHLAAECIQQAERIAELEADYQRLMDKHDALHVNSLKHRTDCDTLRAEVERLRGDSVPLGAIRALAVEAIRDVTGCPDIANGDKCITDTIEHIAQHATYRAIEAAKEAK